MNNLKLVTTEKFGEMDCNFYRNMNDDILLTREQIGRALEYKNPQKAIDTIHERHSDRLDLFSTNVKLRCVEGNREVSRDRSLYTTKGVMEICRWSNSKKANEFMDFCWDTMDKLLHNQPQLDITPFTSALTLIKNEIQLLKYNQQRQQPIKKFSKWKSKINPKLTLLADYLNVNNMTVLRNIYIELEDTYEIDLSEYQEDYCFKLGLDNCSQLDVIEHKKDLRDKFDLILFSLLTRYELGEKDDFENKRETILFDFLYLKYTQNIYQPKMKIKDLDSGKR